MPITDVHADKNRLQTKFAANETRRGQCTTKTQQLLTSRLSHAWGERSGGSRFEVDVALIIVTETGATRQLPQNRQTRCFCTYHCVSDHLAHGYVRLVGNVVFSLPRRCATTSTPSAVRRAVDEKIQAILFLLQQSYHAGKISNCRIERKARGVVKNSATRNQRLKIKV